MVIVYGIVAALPNAGAGADSVARYLGRSARLTNCRLRHRVLTGGAAHVGRTERTKDPPTGKCRRAADVLPFCSGSPGVIYALLLLLSARRFHVLLTTDYTYDKMEDDLPRFLLFLTIFFVCKWLVFHFYRVRYVNFNVLISHLRHRA